MTTNPPNNNPDESKRPFNPGSTQTTIEPTNTNDSTSTREALAEESELVSQLLYIDAFPDQSPERPAIAAGDAPSLFGLDGKPITSLDKIDPSKPILAETINANGEREIVAYSNSANLTAGKPTARLVLESSNGAGGTSEKGTIFRGNTDEILSARAITQDAKSFELTFQVDANGETQKVVFDGSGLPKQFELTRDNRTLQFQFDDAGNVVDVGDSQNPYTPIKEPFRTMFLLAAKQSLANLRAAQGLPEPWQGGDSAPVSGDGDDTDYQPVSFTDGDPQQPEKAPQSAELVPELEVAPAPRVVANLAEMTDKQLVEHGVLNPRNAADVAIHLAGLPQERRAAVITGLAQAALTNSDAAIALGNPQFAEKLGDENGRAFLDELFKQSRLMDTTTATLTRFINTASGFGKFITQDQADSITMLTYGFQNPGNSSSLGNRTETGSKQASNNPELNAAAGKFVRAMFDSNRSELQEPMLKYLCSAGWGQLDAEGSEAVVRSVTGLLGAPKEETRGAAGQALGKLVESDNKLPLTWLNPAKPEAPNARALQFAAVDGLFKVGATTLEANSTNSSTLLEIAKDAKAPESVRQHANALLLKMLAPEGLPKDDKARQDIVKHLEGVWSNPEARTQLVRDAMFVSSGTSNNKDALSGLMAWSTTRSGMPLQLSDEILKVYGNPHSMDVRADYQHSDELRRQIVMRAMNDIPGALPAGAGNMNTASMNFIEQAVRSGDPELRKGANSVLLDLASKSVEKQATPKEVATGRAALDTLVAVSGGAGDIARDADLSLRTFVDMARFMGDRGDRGPALRDSFVRTIMASDHAGHRTKTIARLEEQFKKASPQERLDMLNTVLEGFGDNVNGPGAADVLQVLDRMERQIANPKADAATPARKPEQVLAALTQLTLGTPNHPGRADMVRILTGLSAQDTPHGETVNPLLTAARAEIVSREVYKNPELAGVMRAELEKRYLPQPASADNLAKITRLAERVPELKQAVTDVLANLPVNEQASGQLLYERAFARGGLAAVLEDASKMTKEQSKEVLKIAAGRLGYFEPKDGKLTIEEAKTIADLTNRVYTELGPNSETANELWNELRRLYKLNPTSAQALTDGFLTYSGTKGGAEFFTTALTAASSADRSDDTLVKNLPEILARFDKPEDVKTILESYSFSQVLKNHPGARDAAAKWLSGHAASDDPEMRKVVLAFVAKNGLENFGVTSENDKSVTRDKLIESAVALLKSDDKETRATARDALSRMVMTDAVAARAIVPKIVELLGSKDKPLAAAVKNDLLIVALHATSGDGQAQDRQTLLALLKPVIGDRQALAALMESATHADRNPSLSMRSLTALAALIPDFESQRATITGALVDAYARYDKATEDVRGDDNRKAVEARKTEFDTIFKSLGEKGFDSLKAVVADQLKSGVAPSGLDVLTRLGQTGDATVKQRSKDTVQALVKELDSTSLVRAFGEDNDFNQLIQSELCRRAGESPEQKSAIERALLDQCKTAAGKPSAEAAFKTLGRVLGNSPDRDPSIHETIDSLVELATKAGPDRDHAFNALLAMSLSPYSDSSTASYCGEALPRVMTDEKRKEAVKHALDRFDLNTVDGITALGNVPRTYFGEQVEERLRAVLSKHDPTAESAGEKRNPELFKAALGALLASSRTNMEFLRALAKPGESEAQVIARLLPHMGEDVQNQLRNGFNHTLRSTYGNQYNYPLTERVAAAEALAALGTAGIDEKDRGRYVDDLRGDIGRLLNENIPPAARDRLTRAGDAFMTPLLSRDHRQQNEALAWFTNRVQSGAAIPKEVLDKAMELVGNKDTAGSATAFLLAVSATPGDAARTERVNNRLIEIAATNSDVLSDLTRTNWRRGFASQAAHDVLVQLCAKRPEMIPAVVRSLMERREGDENILSTVSDIANINPARTVQALSERYSQSGGAEPLNSLARLMTSANSAVSGAAKNELLALAQSPKARAEVLDALHVQYIQSGGSEKLLPMLAGLFDNSMQFKGDAKQAIADIATKAKTDKAALELLAFVAGVDGEPGREAAKQLQQLATSHPDQLNRVFSSLGDRFYGTVSPHLLDSPALSLFINISRGRATDPIVTGKDLKQNLLEMVDEIYKGNFNKNEYIFSRVVNVLGRIAGSDSQRPNVRIDDFVKKFGAAAVAQPRPDETQKRPELVGPKQPPPTEPFTKPDGTISTPLYSDKGEFQGYSEVARDKTKITRDAEGRITKVVTPQGTGTEFTWGPQGFVTSIRESSGVEFTSTDGINYRMRPASPISPTVSGELSIEPNGSYSFKNKDGTVLKRDADSRITIKDGDGNLLQRINPDGSAISYNEHGQISETRSATGQVRSFSYLTEWDEEPSEIREPNGAVFKWHHDDVWTQIAGPKAADGQTRTGLYTISDDGALVFKRKDGVRIADNLDGSHVEFDTQNRPTVIRTPGGDRRELTYTGDAKEPTQIIYTNSHGTRTWTRTAIGTTPNSDTWTADGGKSTWTGRVTVQADGTIIQTGKTGRVDSVLRPNGWDDSSQYSKGISIRTNADGTAILKNEAGLVVEVKTGTGRRYTFEYANGKMTSYSDGAERWTSEDGKNWKSTSGNWRVGHVQIDDTGTLRFTSDVSGTQITHNVDGSVITRNNRGLITETVTPNNLVYKYEYAPDGDKPIAMTKGNERWTTTDGANWTLQGATPPRTAKFTLALNQIEGSLIQNMTDTKAQNIFLRNGRNQSLDHGGRVTYDGFPNGTWTRTEYNAQGQRLKSEQQLFSGAKLETTFAVVDGKERLARLITTNDFGFKREYTFDTQNLSSDGQPIVTAFSDEKGWWRRQDTGSGHVYKLDGNPNAVKTGEVKLTRNGEFIQANQNEITIIRNDGTRTINTQHPASTTRTYNAYGRLTETVDHAGLRRRFGYDQYGKLETITEFDGKQSRVFERSSVVDLWSPRGSSDSKEYRHGRYDLDQVTGKLTLTCGYQQTRIEYLTRPPVVIDKGELGARAGDIQKQIKNWSQTSSANNILNLIKPLTWEQKEELRAQYTQLYGGKTGKGLDEALGVFNDHLKKQIVEELNRRNDDTNYSGQIKATLTEIENGSWYNSNRTQHTCMTEIREVLWRMNPEQLEQLKADYHHKYHKDLRDAILDQVKSEPDRSAMLLVLDRAPNGQVDYQRMLDLGMEHRRVDLVRESLSFSNPEFRQSFLENGGEQKIKDRFSADFWDYVFSIATLGIRDLYYDSRGIGAGSTRDVRGLTDYARYGALSEATTVSDHTSWLGDNEEAIELALNTMPTDRRRLFAIGHALANGTPEADLNKLFPHLEALSPQGRQTAINLARIFHGDLEKSMTKAAGMGSSSKAVELAKWRDLILHPASGPTDRQPGTIVSRLAVHCGNIYNSGAQDIFSTIENLSEADWKYLSTMPEADRKKVFEQVSNMLQIIRPEIKDDCMRLLGEKVAAKTWDEAQNAGRRDLGTIIDHNKHRVAYKPEPVFEGLQHMSPQERDRVKNDKTYRDELRNKIVNALGPTKESKEAAGALVDGVLDRIVAGDSALFTPLDRARQGVLETIRSKEGSEHNIPSRATQLKCVNDVVAMLANPAVLAKYQQSAEMRDQLKQALDKVFGERERSKFVDPIMSMIRDGGFPPDSLKDFCGDKFPLIKDMLPRLTAATRDDLLKEDGVAFKSAFGHLDHQKQKVVRSILENNGNAKPEDIARAFVIKWGVDKGLLTQTFQNLPSAERDKACDAYYRKYGTILDTDMRKEVGLPLTQKLLSRNETPEMQVQRLLAQYYQSSDGIGAAFVQAAWDGTPAQARAQADRLIVMHAEASRAFENLKENPEFIQAIKGLNDALEALRESKAGAADAVNTALVTILGIALAPVSGGASMFVVAALLGGALKVGLNMAIMGADYNARDRALTDMLTGGLEAALNMLGPGHVARIFGMTTRAAETVTGAVAKNFGKHLLTDGAEDIIKAGLTKELGQAVASGSHHVADKTLEALARQSLRPAEQTAQNIERLVLMMKNEIKTALAEEVKLTVKNLAREMGIHALTGSGSGLATTTSEALISMATGHGSWDPRLSYEQNMEKFLMQAGTSALIGGTAGSGFHLATRTMRGASSLARSRRGVEIDGLEANFRGAQNPADTARAVDSMIDWAHRAPANQREAAYKRVRETLGITKETWNVVVEPVVSKPGITAAEIQNATKLAQVANRFDQPTLKALAAIPPAERLAAVDNLVKSPHAERIVKAVSALEDAPLKGKALEGLARLTPEHQAQFLDALQHMSPYESNGTLTRFASFSAADQAHLLRSLSDISDPVSRSTALYQVTRALENIPEGERASALHGFDALRPESRSRVVQQLRDFDAPPGVQNPDVLRGLLFRDAFRAEVAGDLERYLRMEPSAIQDKNIRKLVERYQNIRQLRNTTVFGRDAAKAVGELDDNLGTLGDGIKAVRERLGLFSNPSRAAEMDAAARADAIPALQSARDSIGQILGLGADGATPARLEQKLRDTITTNRASMGTLLKQADINVAEGAPITRAHIEQAKAKLSPEDFSRLDRQFQTNSRLAEILREPKMNWDKFHQSLVETHQQLGALIDGLKNPSTTADQLVTASKAVKNALQQGNVSPEIDSILRAINQRANPNDVKYQDMALDIATIRARLRQMILGDRVKDRIATGGAENNNVHLTDTTLEWTGPPAKPGGQRAHIVVPRDGSLGPPTKHDITMQVLNGDGTTTAVTIPTGYLPRASMDGKGVIFSPPDNWTGRRLHYRVMQPREFTIEGTPVRYPNGYVRVGEEVMIPGSKPPKPYTVDVNYHGKVVQEPVLNHLRPDGTTLFQTYTGADIPAPQRGQWYFAPNLRDEPNLRTEMGKVGIALPAENIPVGNAQLTAARDLFEQKRITQQQLDRIVELYNSGGEYKVYHVSQKPGVGHPPRDGFSPEQLDTAAQLDPLVPYYQDASHGHVLRP